MGEGGPSAAAARAVIASKFKKMTGSRGVGGGRWNEGPKDDRKGREKRM